MPNQSPSFIQTFLNDGQVSNGNFQPAILSSIVNGKQLDPVKAIFSIRKTAEQFKVFLYPDKKQSLLPNVFDSLSSVFGFEEPGVITIASLTTDTSYQVSIVPR